MRWFITVSKVCITLATVATVSRVTTASADDVSPDHRVQAEAPPRAGSGLRMSLRLEPGLGVAMTEPQSRITDTGQSHTIKIMFGLSRFLDVGPTFAFTSLPAGDQMAGGGRAVSFGGGARLMRPHDAVGGKQGFYAISPWIDADLLYVRTGGLDRPGFAIGAGASAPIDARRRFWVGPYIRYFQIGQGERLGFDNRDAKILSFGISLEVGTGLARTPVRAVVATVVPPPPDPVVPPSDRDGDGVLDDVDDCPDVAGLVEDGGCPPEAAVVPSKLEVKERISFLWNSSELETSSYAALDDVVRALDDNRGFRVEVEGHASSDGEDGYNQTLSQQRANVVLDYLVSKGIARDRLVSKGFGSTVPLETNTTVHGREANRRVEFVVAFIILKDGNTP